MSAKTHKRACKIHALRRAKERFDAGPELLKALRREFKKRHKRTVDFRDGRKIVTHVGQEFVMLGEYPDGRQEAVIMLDGQRYRAVYNARLNVMVTVMPMGSATNPKGGDSRGEENLEKKQGQEGLLTSRPIANPSDAGAGL